MREKSRISYTRHSIQNIALERNSNWGRFTLQQQQIYDGLINKKLKTEKKAPTTTTIPLLMYFYCNETTNGRQKMHKNQQLTLSFVWRTIAVVWDIVTTMASLVFVVGV